MTYPRVMYSFAQGEWGNVLGGKIVLAARHALYASARDLNPARWSGKTRNWTPVGAVTLNPERDGVVNACSEAQLIQPLAA